MNKFLFAKLTGVFFLILLSWNSFSQTTITTVTTGISTANIPGGISFAVKNNNPYPIAITTFSCYHNNTTTSTGNFNGKYTVWYHPTALTGAPNVTTANGWQQIGVSPNITSPTGIVPVLTNQYFIMPPNTTYRFVISVSIGALYFNTSSTNTWSAGGVDVLTGNNPICPGYAGGATVLSYTPSTFSGAITFKQAAANNVSATSVIAPTSGSQYCAYDSTNIKVIIKNVGSVTQTNVPVVAALTSSQGTITKTGTYTGNLLPFTSDTVKLGKILPPAGYNYSIKAYTQLAADSIYFNDTTLNAIGIVYKPVVPLPVTFDDTVCNGAPAFFGVLNPITNTTYQWYDSLTGGSLVNISNNLTLNGLTNDTSFYISGLLNGCVGSRSIVSVRMSPPPIKPLPADTVLCVSKPLILDAKNPGGKYLWSTGDTTKTLTLTTQSGTYWVKVDKYCVIYDTTVVTIHPEPICTGISYVRTGNTFLFTPSSVQNVTTYLWIFGDGTTSTDSASFHTYAYGIAHPDYMVKLLVGNVCGIDTIKRKVPTSLNDISLENSIEIYPNPATDFITIHSTNALLQDAILMNVIGETVMENDFKSDKEATISIKNLSNGIYFLKINTNDGSLFKRIQITR